MANDKRDKHLGKRYLDLDPRSKNRTLKVIFFATVNGYEVPGHFNLRVETDEANPAQVGTHTEIAGVRLDDKSLFQKLSH